MISTAFLYLAYFAIYAITLPLRVLPDVSLPAGVLSAVSTANGVLSSFSEFLPISTILTAFAAVLGIEAVVLLYKLLMWVITKIPTISN